MTDTAGIFENTADAAGSQTGCHNSWLAHEFDNSSFKAHYDYNIPENRLAGEYYQNIKAYCDYATGSNSAIY
jgi:hypothetical protein